MNLEIHTLNVCKIHTPLTQTHTKTGTKQLRNSLDFPMNVIESCEKKRSTHTNWSESHGKKNRTAKTCPRLFLARMQNIYMQNACANIEARVCTFLVLKLQWPIFFGVAFNFPHVHSLFLSVVYAYETSGTAPLSHNFVFILGICVFSMHLLSKC